MGLLSSPYLDFGPQFSQKGPNASLSIPPLGLFWHLESSFFSLLALGGTENAETGLSHKDYPSLWP